LAKEVDIVTFASPSAVRTWSERVGTDAVAVVIGPTSKTAAEKAGYKRVYCPEGGSKGVEPWAALVEQVASSLATR
jgi:uroporphyrinogen-III synthase